MARVQIFSILEGNSPAGLGDVALSLNLVQNARAQTDTTTHMVYMRGRPAIQSFIVDATLASIVTLLATVDHDAGYPLDIISIDGKPFNDVMTVHSRHVIAAIEDPSNYLQTIVMYKTDNNPTQRLLVDMPFVTIPGDGGAVGFVNLFNSDSDGVPAATPTMEPEEPTPTPEPL